MVSVVSVVGVDVAAVSGRATCGEIDYHDATACEMSCVSTDATSVSGKLAVNGASVRCEYL